MSFSSLVHIAFVLLLTSNSALRAQTISSSGDPAKLRVSTAIAGLQPTSVSDNTTTYTVTTGPPNRPHKVTAQINANMPAGLTLTATFAAPPGAVSVGPVGLDITPRDVVTDIPRNTSSTQAIMYQLDADVTAGVIPSGTRTVTLTILRGA